MKLWSKLKPAEKFLRKWDEVGFVGTDIVREHRFHAERRWKFDFAWPSLLTAVEIQGFGWGHQAQQQIAIDAEKTRAAIEMGWVVIPFTTRCIASRAKAEEAVELVCRILSRRAET